MDTYATPPDGRNPAPARLLTIVGNSARLEGKLQIEESIEIQCEVIGELHVGGTVVIGERANVSADVTTVNAVIVGTYSGNLTASGSVEIASTGRVSGTLASHELVIAKGAIFTGTVSHTEKAAPQPQPAVRPAQSADAVQGQPAPAPADVERAIPVARLIELEVGARPAGDDTSARQAPPVS